MIDHTALELGELGLDALFLCGSGTFHEIEEERPESGLPYVPAML
jgi:hypothetical protein